MTSMNVSEEKGVARRSEKRDTAEEAKKEIQYAFYELLFFLKFILNNHALFMFSMNLVLLIYYWYLIGLQDLSAPR